MQQYLKNTTSFIIKKIFLILLLSISVESIAQLVTSKTVTIPINLGESDAFNMISYEENGMVLMNAKTNNYGRDLVMYFTGFDKNLNQKWSSYLELGGLYELVNYFPTKEGYLYCLYKEENNSKIIISTLNVSTGDYVIAETQLLTPMVIETFGVIKNKIVLSGMVNDRPVIELLNLFSLTGKVLPEIHANNFKISNIELNQEEGLIYILVKNTRTCELTFKTYDYEGKAISSKDIGDNSHIPLSGKLVKLPNGEYMIAGNFADNCSDYSVGIYTYKLFEDQEPTFYDFLSLKNYLNYLSDKKKERFENRITKKKNKGKDFKIHQRIIINEPVASDDGMTLLAEVFIPEYKNNIPLGLPMGRNYRWQTNTYYTFNNFRYTHVLVLHFNRKGDLIWDNSIDLNDFQSLTLDTKVQLTPAGNGYAIAYPDMGKINTVSVGPNVKSQEKNVLDLKAEDRNILNTSHTELISWYDHTFLAYGIQSLKSANGLAPKDVFFISKLTYQ